MPKFFPNIPKPAGARVYRYATNQSVPSTAWTVVQFNAESWDLQNEYDPTTNFRYTAKKAGKVFVHALVTFTAALGGSTDTQIVIRKNAGVVSSNKARLLGDTIMIITDEVSVVAGDYIDIAVYQDSGVAKEITTSPYTWAVFRWISN
jgi:hypothetical protein